VSLESRSPRFGNDLGVVRIWNTQTGQTVTTLDLSPHITSLSWCKHQKELLTAHNSTEHALVLWKFPTMKKLKTFSSESGILSSTENPTNRAIVTSSRNNGLSIWQVFNPPKTNNTVNSSKSNLY